MRWQLRPEIFTGEKQFTLKFASIDGEVSESITVDVDRDGYFDIEPRQQSVQLGIFARRARAQSLKKTTVLSRNCKRMSG